MKFFLQLGQLLGGKVGAASSTRSRGRGEGPISPEIPNYYGETPINFTPLITNASERERRRHKYRACKHTLYIIQWKAKAFSFSFSIVPFGGPSDGNFSI